MLHAQLIQQEKKDRNCATIQRYIFKPIDIDRFRSNIQCNANNSVTNEMNSWMQKVRRIV